MPAPVHTKDQADDRDKVLVELLCRSPQKKAALCNALQMSQYAVERAIRHAWFVTAHDGIRLSRQGRKAAETRAKRSTGAHPGSGPSPCVPPSAQSRLELAFRLADYLPGRSASSVSTIAEDFKDEDGKGPSPELVEEVLNSFACFAFGLGGWVVLPLPLKELFESHSKESRRNAPIPTLRELSAS